MTNIIRTKDGSPFKTEHAAKAKQSVLKKQGVKTEVVQEGEGWVLKTETKKRPKRIPLGTRNVLKYPKRPGYVRRVVNDVEDRIQRFKDAGYEIVQKKDLPSGDSRAGDASQMGMPVSKSVGNGVKAVLMEIPEEWYEEDQKAKQDKIKAAEAAMKQNKGGVEGGYGDLKIGTG
jgi:hypothetical protein